MVKRRSEIKQSHKGPFNYNIVMCLKEKLDAMREHAPRDLTSRKCPGRASLRKSQVSFHLTGGGSKKGHWGFKDLKKAWLTSMENGETGVRRSRVCGP